MADVTFPPNRDVTCKREQAALETPTHNVIISHKASYACVITTLINLKTNCAGVTNLTFKQETNYMLNVNEKGSFLELLLHIGRCWPLFSVCAYIQCTCMSEKFPD